MLLLTDAPVQEEQRYMLPCTVSMQIHAVAGRLYNLPVPASVLYALYPDCQVPVQAVLLRADSLLYQKLLQYQIKNAIL